MKIIKSFFVLFLTGIILSGCMVGRPGMGGMPVTWNGWFLLIIVFVLIILFVSILIKSIRNKEQNNFYVHAPDESEQILHKLDVIESEIKEIKEILKQNDKI